MAVENHTSTVEHMRVHSAEAAYRVHSGWRLQTGYEEVESAVSLHPVITVKHTWSG